MRHAARCNFESTVNWTRLKFYCSFAVKTKQVKFVAGSCSVKISDVTWCETRRMKSLQNSKAKRGYSLSSNSTQPRTEGRSTMLHGLRYL